jgi:hypothetical protein
MLRSRGSVWCWQQRQIAAGNCRQRMQCAKQSLLLLSKHGDINHI